MNAVSDDGVGGCHLRFKIIPLSETCKIMKLIPLVTPPRQNRFAIITTHSALRLENHLSIYFAL